MSNAELSNEAFKEEMRSADTYESEFEIAQLLRSIKYQIYLFVSEQLFGNIPFSRS